MTGLQIAAIVFFGLAFIALVVSVILFFNLEIASVIGDLSGITAKKQIEQIRNQTTNISYGAHKRVQSNHNTALDRLMTDSSGPAPSDSEAKAQAHESKRLRRRRAPQSDASAITEPPTYAAKAGSGTVSLDEYDSDELGMRGAKRKRRAAQDSESEKATEMLNSDEMPTDVLNSDEVTTDVLEDNVTTDVLYNDSESPTDVLNSDENAEDIPESEMPTGVLAPEEDDLDESESPTGVLRQEDDYDDEAPTGLLTDDPYEEGTSVLFGDESGTTVLSTDSQSGQAGFTIISDETIINTDEVIE